MPGGDPPIDNWESENRSPRGRGGRKSRSGWEKGRGWGETGWYTHRKDRNTKSRGGEQYFGKKKREFIREGKVGGQRLTVGL